MFSIFLELVKRVGIFVIIGQTILHFGISKEYEKYMKLVVSLMVAAQVVFAFSSYLKKEDAESRIISSKQYYEEWEKNMKKLEDEFEESQSQLKEKLEQKFQNNDVLPGGEEKKISEIRVEKIVVQK